MLDPADIFMRLSVSSILPLHTATQKTIHDARCTHVMCAHDDCSQFETAWMSQPLADSAYVCGMLGALCVS